MSTLLLGGATVMQVRAPGSFPVDPFFLLIALTYALAIVYAVTLHLVDRHRWLIDLQLACDAIIVSAFISLTGGITSLFSLLYVLPIVAGSIVGFRRGGLLVATLSAVIFSGLVALQYLTADGLVHLSWLPVDPSKLPSRSVAQYIVLLNLFGFFGVAMLSGSLAEGVRSAGARLERASTEIADLQALNQHVIDSLPSGLLTTDPAQRILTFNHAAEMICGLPFQAVAGRPVATVMQLPEGLGHGAESRAGRRQRASTRVQAQAAGRQGDRHRPERDPPRDAGWPRRVPDHLSGSHRRQEARKRREDASASGRGGRNGRRHRARNQKSAGVDVGIHSDPEAGTSAHRPSRNS